MEKKNFFILAGAVASAIAAIPSAADAQKMEKCYGIVKAGLNDCANASGTHSCATLSKKDADPAEWLLLPEGACVKIVGANLGEETAPDATPAAPAVEAEKPQ